MFSYIYGHNNPRNSVKNNSRVVVKPNIKGNSIVRFLETLVLNTNIQTTINRIVVEINIDQDLIYGIW